MRVGDVKSEETMRLIASAYQLNAGVFQMNHPRHGRIEIKCGPDNVWRVTSVEKPEPEEPKR